MPHGRQKYIHDDFVGDQVDADEIVGGNIQRIADNGHSQGMTETGLVITFIPFRIDLYDTAVVVIGNQVTIAKGIEDNAFGTGI